MGKTFRGTRRNVDDTRKLSTAGIATTKISTIVVAELSVETRCHNPADLIETFSIFYRQYDSGKLTVGPSRYYQLPVEGKLPCSRLKVEIISTPSDHGRNQVFGVAVGVVTPGIDDEPIVDSFVSSSQSVAYVPHRVQVG